MQKIISFSLVSIFLAFFVIGAGCAPKGSVAPDVRTDNPPLGNVVPEPVETGDGYKYYTSITKEVCEMKESAQTCEAAGANFFTDDKGCGCITPKK